MLKAILLHDGLAQRITKLPKPKDEGQTHVCVLASNYDEPVYQVVGCPFHQISLINADDNRKLGLGKPL